MRFSRDPACHRAVVAAHEQLVTLYLTPVFYIYMERLRNLGGKMRSRRRKEAAELVLQ